MAKRDDNTQSQAPFVFAPLTPPSVEDHAVPPKHKLTHAERYAQLPPFAEQENPLERASLLSIISMHWIQPLISLGASKVLEMQDLWRVCEQDSCEALETRKSANEVHYNLLAGFHNSNLVDQDILVSHPIR